MDFAVDVSLICYNHARYLRHCLDSILEQKTTFCFWIIIGDDCSTDNSQEIIKEYVERYPDRVVAILNETNLGASQNAYNVSLLCTAKYVCQGESDDYWTDPNRLQKQYDFLENHPEYVAVASNYYNVGPNEENPYPSLLCWQVNKSYFMKKYLRLGFVLHGNTMMIRNIFPVKDEKYIKMRLSTPTLGDVKTRVLLYDSGDIYCMKDIMHAHRMGANDKNSFFVKSKSDPIRYCYMYNTLVESLNEYFGNKYDFSPLLAGRAATVILWGILRINKYDKNSFSTYMQTLPFKTRIYAYYRAAFRAWRSLLHIIGRKLNMYY